MQPFICPFRAPLWSGYGGDSSYPCEGGLFDLTEGVHELLGPRPGLHREKGRMRWLVSFIYQFSGLSLTATHKAPNAACWHPRNVRLTLSNWEVGRLDGVSLRECATVRGLELKKPLLLLLLLLLGFRLVA